MRVQVEVVVVVVVVQVVVAVQKVGGGRASNISGKYKHTVVK